MPSIDERIVSMAFENRVFETRVSTTMATLTKLDTALKNLGHTTGFAQIEAAANKVTLQQPMTALDKLRTRLGMAGQGAAEGLGQIDAAGNKVTLQGPTTALDRLRARLGMAGQGAAEGLGQIDQEGNKVTLQAPMTALDKLRTRLFGAGQGAAEGLGQIDQEGNKVTLQGPNTAIDKLKSALVSITPGAVFTGIEKASNVIEFLNPLNAVTRFRSRLGELVAGRTFSDIERAADQVTLAGPQRAIGNVQNKLDRMGAGSTFTDIERASDRVSFQHMGTALDTLTGKFGILQGAAATALGNIASTAMMKGASFAKSFAFGPLIQGLEEYQTNLKSIQTIMANTEGQRVSGLQATNKYLQELNEYSDQTIYNFSEMAKNIGTFTAAGVALPEATASIKGIANLAALSGSSSQQASTAMYQLSQAIAAGRVSLQDWNSVVNAGMGGAKFQKALMTTAENFGTLEQGAVKIDKATGKATVNGQSFRESIMAKPGQESWLTSDVLTKTLEQFTGDLTAAELKAQGFNDQQIKAILATAKTAKAAATEVKTLSGVWDVAREAIGSGWSLTFQHIFGDFMQAKKLFTSMSQTINGFIGQNADARNSVLKEWNKEGGRAAVIEGLKNAFKALFAILKPIGDAFRDIFPRKTADDLIAMSKQFQAFTATLKPAPETIDNIRRTFRGFFAALHLGWEIVKRVIGVIGELLGTVGEGSGGFLNLTGDIGDFVVRLDRAVTKGKALNDFFAKLTAVLKSPIEALKVIGGYIAGLFKGTDGSAADAFSSSMGRIGQTLKPLGNIIDGVRAAWNKFLDLFEKIKTAISPTLELIGEELGKVADIFKQAITNANWDSVFAALQTTFIGGMVLALKKGLGGGLGGVTLNFLGDINETLKPLTGTLQTLQNNIRANTLLSIALAIGVLAASLGVLSLIPAEKLQTALTATALGLGQLMGALYLMTKASGGIIKSVLIIPALSASLILLGTALIVLAGAMKIFATMSWEELVKGLAGVGGALAAVGVGMKFIGAVRIMPIALALIPLAVGLNVLAVAVKIFATMKWEQLAKGLIGVAGSLTAIAVGMSRMPPNLVITAAGIGIVAAGLILLSAAVASFGTMKLETLGTGIGAIAVALSVLSRAMLAMPYKTLAASAAGLLILGVALTSISGVVRILGGMDLMSLAKGLVSFALMLDILAMGLRAMATTLPGSAALLAAAAAFVLLGPALAFMGNLAWGTILKGLATMAASMAVIATVGYLAATPITALGIAIAALGIGLGAVAASVYLFAKGLSLLGDVGTQGVTKVTLALTAFLALLPKLVVDFLKGMVEIAAAAAEVAPKILESIAKMLTSVIEFLIAQGPNMAKAITALIQVVLKVINDNAPGIIKAGFNLFMNLLKGIEQNIGKITTTAGSIIVKFLDALAPQLPKIVTSGARVIIKFLEGVAKELPDILRAAARVVIKFVEGVTSEIPRVASSAGKMITTFLNAVAREVPDVIRAGVNVIVNIIDGIGKAIPRILAAGERVVRHLMAGIAETVPRLVDFGFRMIIRFLNGIERAIRSNYKQIWEAGYGVADAIIDGMVYGFKMLGRRAIEAAGNIIKSLPGTALKLLGIASPSKVFIKIGEQTMQGLAVGLRKNGDGPVQSIAHAAKAVIEEGEKLGTTVSQMAKAAAESRVDVNPVITPVLDLANVEKEAEKLRGLLPASALLNASTSVSAASRIAESRAAADAAAAAQPAATPAAPSVHFEQHNHSPEPLSNIEIYRQTRNQMAQLRSALGVAT